MPIWDQQLLRAALASPTEPSPPRIRPAVGGRRAAVLVLLGPTPETDDADADADADVTLLERASTLRHHAGQIAFPGGAEDPEDTSLTDTALREAEEEIGIERSEVEVLGRLPSVHVEVSSFDVTTVIASWSGQRALTPRDPAEVASVHRVSLSVLTDPTHRVTATHPRGYTGPAFVLGEMFLWGLTAHLLDAVLDLAGWQRPWDAGVRREVPERFLLGTRHGRGPTAR